MNELRFLVYIAAMLGMLIVDNRCSRMALAVERSQFCPRKYVTMAGAVDVLSHVRLKKSYFLINFFGENDNII